MGSRGWTRQERKAKHAQKQQVENLPVPASPAPHSQFGDGNRLPVVQEPLTDLFSLDQERQIRARMPHSNRGAACLAVALDLCALRIMSVDDAFSGLVAASIRPSCQHSTYVHLAMLYVAGFVEQHVYGFMAGSFISDPWTDKSREWMMATVREMMEACLQGDRSGNAIYLMASQWETLSWQHRQLCATRLLQRLRRSQTAVSAMFENFCAYRHLELFDVEDADDEIDRSPLRFYPSSQPQPQYHPPSQGPSLLKSLGLSILGYWIARRLFR